MATSADASRRSVTPPPKRLQSKDALSPPKKARTASIDSLDTYQLEAFQVVKEGKNLFMTGEAGAGKSYLLDYMRNALPGKVSVCGPTWKAAARIGGTSIHFFAGVNVGKLEVGAQAVLKFIETRNDPEHVKRRWRNCDVLLIDEVSMMHPVVLDSLEEAARLIKGNNKPFGGIRLVLCGDFLQIPPVASAGRFCFEANCWDKLFPGQDQMRTLQGVHRQEGDSRYYAFLRRLRYGFLEPAKDVQLLLRCSDSPAASALQIFATNKSVDSENNHQLHNLPGDLHEFTAKDEFDVDVKEGTKQELREALDGECPKVVCLKLGAPVVLTHVKNEPGWYRGLEGEVVNFDAVGNPVVRLANGIERSVPRASRSVSVVEGYWPMVTRHQVPLTLGWAVTLHKAQGLSLEAAGVQVSDAFEPGMGYVAMSRVRSAAGLRILDDLLRMTAVQFRLWVERKLCRTDQKALEFHLRTLGAEERRQIRNSRIKFASLTSRDWANVRPCWGMGVTLPDRRPSWGVEKYGDVCFRCGKTGHWQADCLMV